MNLSDIKWGWDFHCIMNGNKVTSFKACYSRENALKIIASASKEGIALLCATAPKSKMTLGVINNPEGIRFMRKVCLTSKIYAEKDPAKKGALLQTYRQMYG